MKQVKWIDVEVEEPVEDQFVFYISQEEIDRFHYDDPKSKYWSPAPRFEWDCY